MNKKYLLASLMIGLASILPFFEAKAPVTEAEFCLENPAFFRSELAMVQGNSLFPIVEISNPEPPAVRKIKVIVTAYSSNPWETWGDPFITAAGTKVREGIVANNLLAFGTKVRIPEIFGDKIFVVEDRMNSKKGYYHVDIWFPDYWQALNFGAQRTYIEVLEN